MTYIIIKKIRIEAPTLEEAIQKHNDGATVSLTAEELQARTIPPPRNSNVPTNRQVPLGNRPKA